MSKKFDLPGWKTFGADLYDMSRETYNMWKS